MKQFCLSFLFLFIALFSHSQSITVTYPNGGETLNGCSQRTITWTQTSTSGYFNVEYSTNNGSSWATLATNYNGTSLSWTVPNLSSSQALIRVADFNNPGTTDVSNANFIITPALVVTQPNGGENWQVGGSTRTITWDGFGTSNSFLLEYSVNGGGTWTTITSATFTPSGNTYSYIWTIPNNPSTFCLVRVTDNGSPSCKNDVSDNVFTISPPTPVINVTSPNGANMLYIGLSHTITWTSAYLSSSFVKIEYSVNNGASWTTIISSTNNTGSYTWTNIPNTASTNCLVKISDTGNPSTYDISDAVFTITLGSITVTSPNGGEILNGCQSTNITWTRVGTSNYFNIDYSTDNGVTWSSLGSNYYQAGTNCSFSWTIPNVSSSQALVRVFDYNNFSILDSSNATFTINPALTLTSPNGGEIWQGGTSQTITWNQGTGASNFWTIRYSTNAGNNWTTIVSNTNITNGQYVWNPVPNLPSGNCLIQVYDHQNSACRTDNSDNLFTITPASPVITVTSPNGGNTFYVGSSYNITWTSAYLTSPFVRLEYSVDNGATWLLIANSTNNDGTESWTVPNTPSSQCLVKVSEFGSPSVYDVSNAVFSIVYPYVVVTSPNGGESIAGCSSQTITWTGYGAGTGPWKVEYSANNGTTWSVLTNSTTSSSYTWNPVPNNPGAQYLVKVTRTTDPLVTDVSNSTFTVTLNTSIVINTPNGGESWQVGGGTQFVTWAWSGTSNYYNIYYSIDNGSSWNTIVTNQYITNGQYTWTIPNNPSAQALIMVEDNQNPCRNDVSDAVFTIAPPVPAITVTSPNGGNNFYVGTAYNITWTSAYLSSNFVTIEYSIDNGQTWTTIFASTNNDGSESWTVPNTPSLNCLVRISEFGNPAVSDVSNAVFNIRYPYVVVTAPNGGESWNGCSSQSITWASYGAGTGPWKVEYTTNGGTSWSILTNSTSSSSYTWNPVPNTPSAQCFVRVTKTTDALVSDTSNAAFTITPNTAIVITSPNGGESWQVANPSTRIITWTQTGVSNYYNIYYSVNNGQTWTTIVTNQYITSNQYTWTIPNNPSVQVLVKVEDNQNNCKFDVSDAVFTILPPNPQITVTSPNGGNTFYVGTSYNITWSSQYLTSPFVTLEYSTNLGATWTTILASTNNDGSESWPVPNTPSVQCLIRISEYGNPLVYDISDALFSIVYPYVIVTSPNGGEVWEGCSSKSVTWTGYGAGNGPWRVEYSANGGNTWSVLSNSTTSSSYTWNQVPNNPGSNYLVRVRRTTDTLVSDVSDAAFSVTLNTAIVINSPNGGENWQVGGGTRLITWAWSGTSNYYNIYYSVNNGSSWNTIVTNQYITNGQYSWTIPNNPSAQVLVLVEDNNNTCKYDISDAVFTISSPTPVITVTSPNGGNNYYVGSSYNITWSSAYLSSNFVTIEYSINNGASWTTIFASTANDGSESWTVLNTPSANCLVRVSEYGNPVVNDVSNNVFNIIYPYVTVNTPNGGESWNGCSSQTISWTGFGAGTGPWKVEYSTNNGNTWSTLTNSTTSSSYTWNPVPNIPTTQAIVRVTRTTDALVTDVSNLPFTITQNTAIVITSPNGSEQWQVANPASRLITWTSTGVSNYYNIYYSVNNGQSWTSIVTNQYITSNQYNWTIPNVPSTQVLVKVEDNQNTCKFDVSDAVFTIEAPTPVITVTAPNGGNTYFVGSSYNITWTSQYITSSFVKLEYSTDNGVTWFVIVSATANDGSESWSVPNTPSSQCLVRVSEYGNPFVSDVSNNVFSIVTPYITVNSPNGGETLNGCTSQSISWSGFGTGNGPYRVEFSINNGLTWSLLQNSTTSSSYTWNPVPNITTSQALVRVSLVNNASVNDVSNANFSLNTQSYIIINSPNGGENWQVANPSARTITWASSGVSNYYNIYYSVNGGTSWNSIVTNQYITSNQYNWTVPNNPSNNVLIMVEDNNNPCRFDISDATFTIEAPVPSVTVTAPNGGQTLYSFNNYNITWTSAYLSSSFVKIEYSPDSAATWVLITASTNNTGTYSWSVPNITTTKAYIRITDVGNNAVSDMSDAIFTIKPAVVITAPNGGENLGGCTVTTITWQGEGSSASYSLQYSLNGGNSWTSIVSQTFSGGPNFSYNWTLPNTPSNYCLVRVTHNSNSNKTDQSDAVFSIQPTITVTNPSNGGSYAVGSTVLITWTAQGVSNFYNIDYSTNGGSTWNSIVFNQNITTNSYNWTVPNAPSTNCLIRVTDNNSSCKQDQSDLAFTISSSPASVTVTSPNGGENWTVCSERFVTWSANNTSGSYKIEYSANNGSTWITLENNYPSTNCIYEWTIPSTTTIQGLIRVSDAANGSLADQSNAVFTVSGLSTPGTIAGNTTVCEGSVQTFSVPLVTGASSYTWTLPAGWTGSSNSNTINCIAGSSGGNISVFATNNCSTGSPSQKAVAVTALPETPGIISGNIAPCSGVSQTYSISNVSGATSYSWLLPSGYTGSSTTNTINVVTGINPGNIQVYALNSCGTGNISSLQVTPDGGSMPQQPGNISGTVSPCSGTIQTYSIVPVSGATSYTWTLPSGWAGSSSSSLVDVTAGTSGGTISVVAHNSCGTSVAQNLTVSVANVPTQPGAISGNTSVCLASANTYSISTVSGAASYSWTLPSGWTGISNTTAIAAISSGGSGNVLVTANNSCGASQPRILAVTVNNPVTPSVSVAQSPTGSLCGNATVSFTATPVNGGTPSYQWVKNNMAVGTNSPSYTASGWNVNDSVWVLMTSGLSCITSTQVTSNKTGLNITPVIVPSITILTDATTICSGQNVTFEALISGGGTDPVVQWRKNGTNISGANSLTFSTNTVVNGDIYTCVLISNAPCASPVTVTSNSLTMSVSNNLTASVSISSVPSGTICNGTDVTFTPVPANGGTNPQYEWTVNGLTAGYGNTFTSSLLNNNDIVQCFMTSSLTCVLPNPAPSNPITMSVNPNVVPEVTITADNNPVCTGQPVTFTATTLYGGTSPLYQWRKNGSVISGASGANYITSSIDENDIFDVILTSNYSCLLQNKDTSNAVVMSVSTSVMPSVLITVIPDDTVCNGTTVTFTAFPLNGGTNPSFQWKKNGVDIPSANSSTYSTTGLTNGDVITVVLTSDAPCASVNTTASNPVAMVVLSNSTASVTISGNPSTPACSGDNVLFTATPANGGNNPAFQWYKNSLLLSGEIYSTYSTSSLSNGDQISVSMTTSKQCALPLVSSSNTLTYSIVSTPSMPGAITGVTSACQGQHLTYSVTPVAGATFYTWTLPSGWTGTSTSGSINVTTGSSGGTISVTAGNSCGISQPRTLGVNINPLPEQPDVITGNTTICSGSSQQYSVNPSGFATSYTWTLPSGWTGTSATTNISTVAGTVGGNITVTANNSCGSSPVTTLVVNVNSVPSAPGSVSGNSSICSGVLQTYSVTPVSGATSYNWTLPAGWSGSSGSNSISATPNQTSGTVSVVASNSCGVSNPTNLFVNVSSIPDVPSSISGSVNVCQNQQLTYSVTPVSGATFYTWTLPQGWTGTSSSNSINVTAGSSGGNISVTAGNTCGSSDSRSLAVTVNPLPGQPGNISGNMFVCSGSSQIYSVSPVADATSYTWTLPSGWVGTSATESISCTVGLTGGNITVRANNACGVSQIVSLAVTVGNIPATPGLITGNSSVCSGTQQTYSVLPVSGATSYTWTLPAGWSGTSTTESITSTPGISGGTITVTAQNICGISGIQSMVVTVNNIPGTPGMISGNINTCQGVQDNYSVSPVTGATFYTWTLPNGWMGNSTTNMISATPGLLSGDITVTAGNACGNSLPAIQYVSVNQLPAQPQIISGNTSVCSGAAQNYSVAPVNYATSYTWTLPPGWTGASSTASLTTTAGAASGYITVTADNYCGSSLAQTLYVHSESVPAIPGTISGNQNPCPGSTNVFSVTPIPGATSYTWTLPAGWSGSSTTSTISATSNNTGGFISVAANNNCGISSAQTLSVNVTDVPNAAGIITGASSVCQGQSSVIYTVPVIANATSYQWTLPPGASGTSNINSITVSFSSSAQTGNITVRGINTCGEGTVSSKVITVDPLPAAAGIVSGPVLVCQGQTNVTYSVPVITNAISYEWILPNGVTGSSSSNSINVTFSSSATSGNISVRGVNTCGEGLSSSLNITVSQIPEEAGVISGPAEVCAGDQMVQFQVPVIAGATSYIWTFPNGVSGSGSTNSIDLTFDINAVSGYITVHGTNTCGDGLSSSRFVTVNAIPPTPVISQNGSTLISSAPLGNQWYNQFGLIPGAESQTYTVQSDGDYYVMVTLDGCSSETSNHIYVVVTGFGMEHEEMKIRIFPNPCSEALFIETEGISEVIHYDILNALGQIIITGEMKRSAVIQVQNLARGVYYIRLKSSRINDIRKFVRE